MTTHVACEEESNSCVSDRTRCSCTKVFTGDRRARQLHFPWLNLEMAWLVTFERDVRVPRITHTHTHARAYAYAHARTHTHRGYRIALNEGVHEGHVRTAQSWVCFGSPKYQLEMETSPFMLIPVSLKLSRSSHCSLLSLGAPWASPTLLASCASYQPSPVQPRSSGYQFRAPSARSR